MEPLPSEIVKAQISLPFSSSGTRYDVSTMAEAFKRIPVTKYVPYAFWRRKDREPLIKIVDRLTGDFSNDVKNYFDLFMEKIEAEKEDETFHYHIYVFYLAGDEVQKKNFTIVDFDFSTSSAILTVQSEDIESSVQRFSHIFAGFEIGEPMVLSQEQIFRMPTGYLFLPHGFADAIFNVPGFRQYFQLHGESTSFAFKKQVDFHFLYDGQKHRLTLENVFVGEDKNKEFDYEEGDPRRHKRFELSVKVVYKSPSDRESNFEEFQAELVKDLTIYMEEYNEDLGRRHLALTDEKSFYQYLERLIEKSTLEKTESEPTKNPYIFPPSDYRKKCQGANQPTVSHQKKEGYQQYPNEDDLKDPEVKAWFQSIPEQYRKRYWYSCQDNAGGNNVFVSKQVVTGEGVKFFPCCQRKSQARIKKAKKPPQGVLTKNTYLSEGRLARNPEIFSMVDKILKVNNTARLGMKASRFASYFAVQKAIENKTGSEPNLPADLDSILNWCRQELYDYNKIELDIELQENNLDTIKFYRYLEEKLGVNVFVIQVQSNKVDLEIPRNAYGHYRRFVDRPTVVLYKYKKDRLIQYEPIVQLDEKDRIKSRTFDDVVQNRLLDLIGQKQKITLTDGSEVLYDFDPVVDVKNIDPQKQMIDCFGKGRGFILTDDLEYESETPFQPYPDFENVQFKEPDQDLFKRDYQAANILLQIYHFFFVESRESEYDFTNRFVIKSDFRPNLSEIALNLFLQPKDNLEKQLQEAGVMSQEGLFYVPTKEDRSYVEYFLSETGRYPSNPLIQDFYLTPDDYRNKNSAPHQIFDTKESLDRWIEYKSQSLV